MQKRLFIFIIAVVFINVKAYSQDSINMVQALGIESDLAILENRVLDLLKKDLKLSNTSNLRQFHIFYMDLDDEEVDIEKEEYKNSSFLQKLLPTYYNINIGTIFKKKKSFLKTCTIVIDSIGNLVACGNAYFLSKASTYSKVLIDEKEQIVNLFIDEKIDFVCSISLHLGNYYVGIKNGKAIYLITPFGDVKLHIWEEFIDCCLEEWYPYKRGADGVLHRIHSSS